jgi:hypothetical protein
MMDGVTSPMQLGTICPLLVVWLVGAGLIVSRARRNPKATWLAVGGIALAAAQVLCNAHIYSSIVTAFYNQGMGAQDTGVMLGAISLAGSIMMAIAWGLIIAAVVAALRDVDDPVA